MFQGTMSVSYLCLFVISVGFMQLRTVASISHLCNVSTTFTNKEVTSCGDYMDQTVKGWTLDLVASGVKDIETTTLSQKIQEWMDNPYNSPQCTFLRLEERLEEQCCTGWSDYLCDKAVCKIPCANGGTCTSPDMCACVYPFSGFQCDEVVSETDDTHQYCYKFPSCEGEKVDRFLNTTTTRAACCEEKGFWGRTDHSCARCDDSGTRRGGSD